MTIPDRNRRWRPRLLAAGAAVVTLSLLDCSPMSKRHEGGGWYTRHRSSWSMDARGRTALYRRVGPGAMLRVESDVYLRHFEPPDCIIYETQADADRIQAACGARAPVVVAEQVPWRQASHYEVSAAGLRRVDTVRAVRGRPVATVSTIRMADIRRAAESRPGLIPLWRARRGRGAALRATVREEPVYPQARDRNGATPLHRAAFAGDLALVEALLRAGADVNAPDALGRPPLQLAIESFDRSSMVIARLIAAGADVEIADELGRTVLHAAVSRNDTSLAIGLLASGADPCRRDPKGASMHEWAGDAPMRRIADSVMASRCR